MNRNEISLENDFDFYYNAVNIPNQDLVFATVEYFETGPGKNSFEPLEFLNILYKQFGFVKDNIQKPHSTITYLKELPLDNREKHTVFGFILKWFGGYPIENMDPQFNTTLRLIEKEFLSFQDETPEKKFCQKNWQNYKRDKQIEYLINANLKTVNSGLEDLVGLKKSYPVEIFEKADENFLLKEIFDEADTIKIEVETYKSLIERQGYMEIIGPSLKAKIYNHILAYTLTTKDLGVKRQRDGEFMRVNPMGYINTFLEGFKKGREYFSENFKITPEIIYGGNSSAYIEDLHEHYYHSEIKNFEKGWSFVKTTYPLMLSHQTVAEYGHYSGIVSEVNDLIAKYPILFRDFDKHSTDDTHLSKNEPSTFPLSYSSSDKLFEAFNSAWHSIHAELSGNSFKAEKQNAVYENFAKDFLEDFNHILLNNIQNTEGLTAFINEVYYNKILQLMPMFAKIGKYRLGQLNNDYGIAVNDDMFLKIQNGYVASLAHLAEKIRTEAKKHKILELKHHSEIKDTDFNISGEYIPLLNWDIVNKKASKQAQKQGIKDIFIEEDYTKYFNALTLTKPPLLTEDWVYIGKTKHKGIVASWFKHLQHLGIIKQRINRETLAQILNDTIKEFNLGVSGRTISEYSPTFEREFKDQLEKVCPVSRRRQSPADAGG
ncbi:hypothetical protein [Pedobacter ghigonis]|uniref:hypothetical protein n=1 Tax=Pedobacter ghigonis TaxID=2730403 RepID=UPI0015886204|nr:hypothetical protein [Pedobacter ghigonis]